FLDYEASPLAQAAANDLSQMTDFRGPKVSGHVTTQTLFRDTYPGCTTGPYISQFLLQPAPFGAQEVDQRVHSNAPKADCMTTFQDWLDVQNGLQPTQAITPGEVVFCKDGRELSPYVHVYEC